MRSVATNVATATARPSATDPKNRLQRAYSESPAKLPAPSTHGTSGMVSQKSNVTHAPMRLPINTPTEANASEVDAAGLHSRTPEP
jgi:hypothetical protein